MYIVIIQGFVVPGCPAEADECTDSWELHTELMHV